MNATKITTHVEDAKKRLLYQYNDSVKLKDLIDSLFGNQIQDLENALWELKDRLNIDASSGIQLDKIGAIVGQERLGFQDQIYRLFIKARIGKNTSESEIEKIITVWKLMSQSTVVHLVEGFPAELYLYYNVPLPEYLVTYTFELIQKVCGAGISIGYIAVFDSDCAFGFESLKPNICGFGDLYDPNLGGKLSYIQNVSEYVILYSTPVFGFYPDDPDIETKGFGDVTDLTKGGKLAYIDI